MNEFLKTWYGLTLFIIFDAAAVLAVMAIAYRWVFKRVWYALASIVCMAVLSPLYLAIFVRGKIYQKKNGGMETLTAREFFVGKKAKAIALHVFRTTDDEGNEAGRYGRWLKRTGFYKLPYLFDVFCGSLSFLGVRALSFEDAAFVSESDEGRYAVRPGLINPLAATGDGETDYEEMFHSDTRYAKKMSLFGDWKIFFYWLLKKARGEGRSYLGVTAEKTYAEALLDEGRIAKEDFEIVSANAAAEEEELRKTYEPEEEPEAEEGGTPDENGEAETARTDEAGGEDKAEQTDGENPEDSEK